MRRGFREMPPKSRDIQAKSIIDLKKSFPSQELENYYEELNDNLSRVPQICSEEPIIEKRLSIVIDELRRKGWNSIKSIDGLDEINQKATRIRIQREFEGAETFLDILFSSIHNDFTLYESVKLEIDLAPILNLITDLENKLEAKAMRRIQIYIELAHKNAGLGELILSYDTEIETLRGEFQSLNNDLYVNIGTDSEKFGLAKEYEIAFTENSIEKFVEQRYYYYYRLNKPERSKIFGTARSENDPLNPNHNLEGDGKRYGAQFHQD